MDNSPGIRRTTRSDQPRAGSCVLPHGVGCATLHKQPCKVGTATQVWSGIDVASQLLWAIGEAEADVVAMDTHVRSGVRGAVMGSVAES